MGDRVTRLVFGVSLLLGLYFNLTWLVLAVTAFFLFEGVTNLRVSRLMDGPLAAGNRGRVMLPHFGFEAERLFRLLIGLLILTTYLLFPEKTWFFPWFIGFMVLLAGIINVCPMIIILRQSGFR